MWKLIFVAVVLVTAEAVAEDILIFKHGVEFDHKRHQTEKVGVCTVCHEEQVGKIKGFGKEWAHRYCINCHNLHNEGLPVYCGGCHKTMGKNQAPLA